MPRYRRKRKAFRRTRKTYKKRGRRRRRRPKFGVRRMGRINPDAALVKLVYQENVIPVITVASFNFTFSMNSCFDPNTTGTGLQPAGFDTYAAQYFKYQVYASTCRVEAVNLAADVGFYGCLYPSVQSSGLGYGSAVEQKYAINHFIGNRNGNSSHRTLKKYMSPMRISGESTFSTNFSSQTGSSPTSQRFWHYAGVSADLTTLPAPALNFKVTYYVKFFDRQTQVAI